jgi:alcohol dehydrogenase class IV
LTQVIEPFVSCRANPMTDAVCREGILRAARSLRTAFNNGADSNAREDMSLASLFGGLALANAGLGAVHGFAGPIGGMFSAPHGGICAALLPQVMEINLRTLRERESANPAVNRYQEVARLLTGDRQADSGRAVEWVRQLVRDLKIPQLGAYGIKSAHVPALVENAARASSMKANPIVLTQAELTEALERSL